jgi:phospholipase A-2-activating protein
MNITAAKSKIASLNADLKLLSADDEAVLGRVYPFLELPAGQLPSTEAESGGEAAEGLMRIVQSWPEAQRFPRE